MNVIGVYNDVLFRTNQPQNGDLPIAKFNQISWLAQLNLIDWLSGSLSGNEPPEPFLSQKNIDWLSDFIVQKKDSAVEGRISKPDDYYLYQALFRIVGKPAVDCDEDDDDEEESLQELPDKPITLLSVEKFNKRVDTYIDELKPTLDKGIAKIIGKEFEFAPKDMGSVKIEYVRYPKKAEIKTKIDNVYNNEVPDELNSIDFEWSDNVRPILIWFICDEFFNSTREKAGKEFNAATGKTPRG